MDTRRLISAGALALSLCGVGSVLAASRDDAPPTVPVAAAPVAPPAPAPEAPPFLPAPPAGALVVPDVPEAEGSFDEAPKAKRVETPEPTPRAEATIAEAPVNVPAPEVPAPPPAAAPLLPQLAACVAEAAPEAEAPVAEGTQFVEAWRVELDADLVGAPALHEGCVVALTTADRLVAVLADSGEVVADEAAPEAVRVAAGTEGFAEAVAAAAPLPALVAGGVAAEVEDAPEAPATPRAAAPAPVPAAEGSIDAIVGQAVLLTRGTVISAPARALVGFRPAPAPAPAAPVAPAPPVALPEVPVAG